MRNITLRKSLNFQLVATVFVLLLITVLAVGVYAQEVKPIIVDALNKGDTALAIDLLNQEIEIDKTYHLNYYTLGMIYFERQEFNKAVEQFETALDKKKKHYESLYYLGMSQLKLGNIDEAEKTFKTGIKKDKKEKHRFEDGMGLVLMEHGKYQDAGKLFRKALVNHGDNPMYHIHLGNANFYQGVPPLAIIEYGKALELDTAGLEVYYHWAEACLEIKDYTCAIEKLKVVLTKDSTHAPSWMRAAGIYFKAARSSNSREERNNRFRETIGAYKRYLELSGAQADSANVRGYFELAMSYSALNGFEDAVDYYNKVLAIPYEPKDIYFNYGKALLLTKKYVEGGDMMLKHLDWVSKQDTDTYKSSIKEYELYKLLGDSYYYRKPKEYFIAIGHYKKSLEFRSDQKRLVQNIALGYNNLKSYAQALEYYEKRIEFGVEEKTAFLYKYAGNCALALANSAGEEDEDIDEEEGEEPTETVDPVALYTLAAGHFDKYIEFKPQDTATVFNIANTYFHQLSDCTNGVKYYEMVLTLDPNHCDASKYLGFGYLTGEVCTINYTKALNYLKKAQTCISAKGNGCEDIGLILGIAQSYHLRGAGKLENGDDPKKDYQAAYDWYGKVLKCEPGHTVAKEARDGLEFEI